MSQQKPNRTSDDTYKRRLFYDNGIRFVEVNGRMTGEYNPPTPILKVAANVNIQSSSSFINKISIHPMLRFNWEKILGIYPKARFQYILCYGSTGRRFLGFIQRQDFNTSYVTVQLTLPLSVSVAVPDFNTSYVTVQQYLYVFKIQGFFDFNTSYVTVQHYNHIFLKNH